LTFSSPSTISECTLLGLGHVGVRHLGGQRGIHLSGSEPDKPVTPSDRASRRINGEQRIGLSGPAFVT
jgi:hypothetical protein